MHACNTLARVDIIQGSSYFVLRTLLTSYQTDLSDELLLSQLIRRRFEEIFIQIRLWLFRCLLACLLVCCFERQIHNIFKDKERNKTHTHTHTQQNKLFNTVTTLYFFRHLIINHEDYY